MFFGADGGLWRTDGTAAGTALVAPVAVVEDFTEAGGRLFFSGNAVGGRELWISDGTTAGTRRVADINPGGSSNPREITALGNSVLFSADDGVHGFELWRSDGTLAGTSLVLDVYSGNLSSTPIWLTAWGNQVLFSATEPGAGRELWSSDGTTGGTSRVADIWRGLIGSSPRPLVEFGGGLLFSANAEQTGRELWFTDGTAAGTRLLHDLLPGPLGSNPDGPRIVAGDLYLATDSTMWVLDASLRAEPVAGLSFAVPWTTTASGRGLLFSARDPQFGREPWVTDRARGTRLLGDLRTLPPSASESSFPTDAISAFGAAFFGADGSLWKSDGTTAGTVELAPVLPTKFVAAAGSLFFFAGDFELWKTDGTAVGTVRLRNTTPCLGCALGDPVLVGETLFFPWHDLSSNVELWKSDGTVSGTQIVRDLVPGTMASWPLELTAVGDQLFFSAYDRTRGRELWKSDGTAAGTVVVADINPNPPGPLFEGSSTPRHLTEFGGVVLFAGDDGSSGEELWRSDGTAAGTVMVRDIHPALGSSPSWLTEYAGALYFAAGDAAAGRELWRTDGTAAGTAMVADIAPGAAGSDPTDLHAIDAGLVFVADDGTSGRELWISDGTARGTRRVADISPGTAPSVVSSLQRVGRRRVYFWADDGVGGREPWSSDGTAANTVRAADIRPGSAGSGPQIVQRREPTAQKRLPNAVQRREFFGMASGVVIAMADDGVHGSEPWALDAGAVSVAVGAGCGTATRPTLAADDPVLGAQLGLSGTGASSGRAVVVLVGEPAARPILLAPGCWSYLELSRSVVLTTLAATGNIWTTSVPVPATPSLAGITLGFQALLGPTAAPLGLDLSNGALATFGL